MSFATSVQGGAMAEAATRDQVIGTYATYAEAQRAVDYLADSAFPVDHTSILGRDLTLVEQVTGRMTNTRATAMGAAAGAWFGPAAGFTWATSNPASDPQRALTIPPCGADAATTYHSRRVWLSGA